MPSPDVHVRRTGDDYATQFLASLPEGDAWPKDDESDLSITVGGLCQIWGTVDGSAADLLEIETDPTKANVMLPDWERNFGLPDPCLPNPPSDLPTRRVKLVQRITLKGAQDRAFLIALAAQQGLTVTIREYSPYQCGISGCGDTTKTPTTDDPGYLFPRWGLGGLDLRYYFTVTIPHVLTGSECIIRRNKPAHSVAVFAYTSNTDRQISCYPWLGF